jgi:hypothetical protein
VTSKEGIVDEFATSLAKIIDDTLLFGKLCRQFHFVSHKLFDLLKDIAHPICHSLVLGKISMLVSTCV